MPEQQPPNHFNEDRAASYDDQFARLAPLKDALHLCMRAVLAEAPENARVLCVGAGTGAELLYLAEAFPKWTFTLVEPSAPMLDRCRQKAAAAGIAACCTFHEGYLDTLPPSAPFDIATSILVSQFILDPEARCAYFRGIAERLHPGGHLVTADLATDLTDEKAAPAGPLFDAWLELMRYNGADDAALKNYRTAVTSNVAVLPAHYTEGLIASAGFSGLRRIAQTLLIHTWHARRQEPAEKAKAGESALARAYRYFAKLRFRSLGLATIKDIPTDNFNALMGSLQASGWHKTYEYDGMDAWIDYGMVKLRKGDTELTMEWDNWTEGSIEGPAATIETLGKAHHMKVSYVWRWSGYDDAP